MTGYVRKRSLFVQFLFSYIVVLLIPIIYIIYLNNQYVRELENELLTNNANTLNRVMYVVDSNIKQLDNVKSHVLMNRNLDPYYALDTPALAMDAKNELGKYLAANSFITEIAIYFRGDSFLYTSHSSYTIPFFISNAFRFQEWSEEEFTRDINACRTPVVRAAQDVLLYNQTDRLITFVYPLSEAKSVPTTTLLFFVNEGYFAQIMQDHFGDSNSISLIMDQNDQIVTTSSSQAPLPIADVGQYLEGIQDVYAQVVLIDKEKYVVSALVSKDTGWKYVSFTPIGQAFRRLYEVQLRVILAMAMLLLAGGITIYYGMKKNYSPIRNLRNHASKIQKCGQKTANELDIVISAIDYLTSQNERLISESKVASKDFLLKSLLKGRIDTLAEINRQGESFGVRFCHPAFLIVQIMLHDAAASLLPGIAELSDKIEREAERFFNGYVSDCMDMDRFVLILSLDEQSDYKKGIRAFQMHLEKELRCKTTVGVGDLSRSPKDVPLSYLESSIALDYRLIKGAGSAIFHDELSVEEDSLDAFPHKELDALKYIIKQGNAATIETAIDNIIGYIKACNLPLFIARGICFSLVNVTWRSAVEIGREALSSKANYPNISMLANYDTIDELTGMVKGMCANICTFLHESKDDRAQSLTDDIASYIQENYTDSGFSVQIMADHFGIALTQLSQHFKKHTGQTVIDYTTNLRIEKAKELLAAGGLNINDICTQVGYINTSSFIRRFKQMTGLTPGQYMAESTLEGKV